MGEKLYFIGGDGYIDEASKKITESYDFKLMLGQTYNLCYSRKNVATASLGGKLYAIGGRQIAPIDLEIYDPLSNTWSLDSNTNLLSI